MILLLIFLAFLVLASRVILSEPYTDAKKVVREKRTSMRIIKTFFLASFALLFDRI